MADVVDQTVMIEMLMPYFPIVERGGVTIFPRPDGNSPLVFLQGRGFEMYGVELSLGDTLQSVRDKLEAGMKELYD
jgi:hypothetical protein